MNIGMAGLGGSISELRIRESRRNCEECMEMCFDRMFSQENEVMFKEEVGKGMFLGDLFWVCL
jgi:hypothetical protein